MNYEFLIQEAIRTMDKAITRTSKVGSAILCKDGSIFTGFNIQMHTYQGYHAEEIALIGALRAGYKKNDFEAIAIVCEFEGSYPACAECRQKLWEFTNPELKVIYFDMINKKGEIFLLKDLYPYPYPDFKSRKESRTNLKVEENVQKETTDGSPNTTE